MRDIISKFALAATFALALAFTFSCSGDDGGGGDDPQNPSSSSSNAPINSSSSGNGASSSSTGVVGSSSSNGTGSSSSSGGTNPSSSSNGQSSSSSSVSGSSSSAEAARSSSSSAGTASSSSQTGGNSSSSQEIVMPSYNPVDTAYAFECNYFEAGDCNSTDSDKIRMDINGAINKTNAAAHNAFNSGMFTEIIYPALINDCPNKENITGVVVDVQADLTFMEPAPIVGAGGAPAEKSAFIESVKSLSDAQFRAKMDSVAGTYPKNASTGKRQFFRYNIFIQEEGFEWPAVRHVRHTNCSTDFQELCSEDTAGNLKGARVSLFTCVQDVNWENAQNSSGLFTRPNPRAALQPMIPVYRVK